MIKIKFKFDLLDGKVRTDIQKWGFVLWRNQRWVTLWEGNVQIQKWVCV